MTIENDSQSRQAFCLKIGEALLKGCERHEVPREALGRLIGPEGTDTMDAITFLIEAEYRSLSVPRTENRSVQPTPLTESSLETILVPDLDAVAITALARERCRLTHLDGRYDAWDYFIDLDGKPISGRGKRFEVLIWNPSRGVSSDEVRKHFQKRGFYGHTAAFIAWIAQRSLEGYYASIPEDDACWHLSYGGCLYAPYSCFADSCRRLSHERVDVSWNDDWSFVAFREL